MDGATTFPVSMARGATWDVALEERIGQAIGRELRALGGNLFGGVCINLLRHPAWGRAQETYGEDPYHLGELGAALTRGVQRPLSGPACAEGALRGPLTLGVVVAGCPVRFAGPAAKMVRG